MNSMELWICTATYLGAGRHVRALMQAEELERLVEKTAARIDRHVVNTLLDKYSFVSHCSAIKRYLLLSQVRHQDPPEMHRTVRLGYVISTFTGSSNIHTNDSGQENGANVHRGTL